MILYWFLLSYLFGSAYFFGVMLMHQHRQLTWLLTMSFSRRLAKIRKDKN
ncbi:hypothetical protein QWZ13_09540 [Reinekea marina]|nr:hypothetical protein [Reinekea marina]MDN3649152.1 hypothetical protein [Reinekea marina]